ncbi:cysteine--tRNA ligase [Mesorhizobium sp. KR9-304]|uniref:cysteine--tRNA ligase n=1 Tax=Mesorhizobium sp. KR9-304 TaxID=3156614 RepID=UPI0032B5E315
MSDAKLRLYNTLTRTKEDFVPIDRENVRLYVCGPTVYDFAHIGNARPVIVFDVLFRLLRHLYGADHVTYVRNITDVDDKINARAARNYPGLPLNEAIRKVTEETNAQFQADVKALGCLEPTFQPRATEHIDAMKAMIERLIDLDVAYVAEGHVLFSPKRMAARVKSPRYGALARRSLDEMLAGARVDVASYKEDEMDFVLWKPSKPGEPGWPSPSGIDGLGRPGWHIECSAMSMAKLLEPFGGGLKCDDPQKNVFDIHAGGIDLVFPHHENEIAQSCCAFGTERMANIWMHNGFLQVEGRKMSKSEGNFVTINELLNTEKFGGRKWPGEVLRLAMLMTHYRQPIDFSLARLEEAEARIKHWTSVAKTISGAQGFKLEPDSQFLHILTNDLNTVEAIFYVNQLSNEAVTDFRKAKNFIWCLTSLGVLIKDYNRILFISTMIDPSLSEEQKRTALNASLNFISAQDGIRILLKENEKIREVAEASIRFLSGPLSFGEWRSMFDSGTLNSQNEKILARLALIAQKNWAEADRIRDELLAQGIQLKDGKDPATGERVTTWEVKR